MTSAVQVGGLLHTAVCHRSTAEAIEQLLPFVQEGLWAKEDVFVNLSAERAAALSAELGEDADRVRWSDTNHWHPHPARRLRAIQELADGAGRHGRGRLRFIGECAFSTGLPYLVAEWERFEAVLNHALADLPISMVCTYDCQQLAPEVVERSRSSHPRIGLLPPVDNDDYQPPAEFLAQRRGMPLPAPVEALRLSGSPTPHDARALVQRVHGGAGIDRQKVDDMAVAVTEVVTNAWQAGAQHVDVACWYVDGEAGVQVDDDGPGLRDPLAGYRRPAPSDERGRGLWIARQLADVLDVWPHDRGTAVRLRLFDAAP